MADRVKWGPGRRDALKQWLRHDMDRALGQRSRLEETWRKWLNLYRAPLEEGIAHYPFEGASNVTIPIAAMNVDPILARWMQNIHAGDNLWTLKPLNERWIDRAKPLQDYLTWLDRMQIKMWDVNYRVFLETLKLGTGIYKTSWRYERRSKVGYDRAKNRVLGTQVINQPFVDQVHLANFLIPSEARSVDPDAQSGARWVAERHRLFPNQLRAMGKGQAPFLPNFIGTAVEEVVKFWESADTEHQQTVTDLDKLDGSLSQVFGRPIEIWEVHARFDTTGNGIDDDIVVVFHPKTFTILRATYATMPFRPYSVIRYMRGDGFYGIGICEMSEVWQNVGSRVLNFDIDKILLSNSPMLAIAPGANVVPDEPIFPGKQWHLNNPKEDLVPFHLVAPGTFDIAVRRLGRAE